MNSRYQPPSGDIYLLLVNQYGRANADRIAAADRTTDPYDENTVLAEIRSGHRLNDSTLSNFWGQVTTNPLEAPLASANDQIGKAVLNVFKNPWVLFALGLYVFLQLGGFHWLRKQLA